MKQVVTAFLGLTLLTGSAGAGVVVEEQQVIDRGVGTPSTSKITVMVQGNKQKYVIGDGKQSSITDLDKGTRAMISNARKMYVEMPFPSKGMMTQQPSGAMSALTFKQTGGHEKIAGFACDDYTGTGSLGENEMTVTGCFSTTAPGAANFTAFQKTMTEKVKGTPMALMSDTPAGIPLKIDTSLKQKTGSRPPIVTHMTVTKVTEQDLSADTFLPPKNYAKQQMPTMGMMGPGMMGKPAAGAPPASPGAAPSKVPE